jgi:hypothetical protein
MDGHVAEWLRRGLQILAPRFDSGRGLQNFNDLVRTDERGKNLRQCFVSGGLRFTRTVVTKESLGVLPLDRQPWRIR